MPEKLDKQLLSQPKEVVFCKKCVVSNQRPRITFDKEGVCSACQYAERKLHAIDWDAREKELAELLEKHRSKDGSFDVVVPGSGGKDSAYTAHYLKTKYGMHPLTVTWSPFIYTDIGWRNFNAFVQSGFSALSYYQNGSLHRKLAKVAFELKGDAWEPFAYGQKAYAFHMALKFKIPLIFYGENGEVEYGGTTQDADKPVESVADWERVHYKGAGVDKLVEKGLEMSIFEKNEVEEKKFELYRAPDIEVI